MWSLFGIAGGIAMACLNKFNLVQFALRLVAYIYSKFLKTLAHNMDLAGGFAVRDAEV